MRLYHSHWAVVLFVLLLLTACSPPRVTQALISVRIVADGKEYQVQIPAGSMVQDALTAAGIVLGELDRSEPPVYTVLTDGASVRLVRVREEYYIEQVVVPFETRTVLNESLPAGETRLSQPGVNGLQEITYRKVFEDGTEISTSVVKTVTLQDPVPEIIMMGSQTPFATLPISGRIVYLAGGNAWVMEGTTSNRRPVVMSGDLDGQIFALSPDGNWLVYTRRSNLDGEINTLWAARLDGESVSIVNLNVANVIHFAAWSPRNDLLAYSTVEPRPTAPGWQANNDLITVSFSPTGVVAQPRFEIEPNSGGVYGWWGTDFAWGVDGFRIAYARPDQVGFLDIRLDSIFPLLEIIPYRTGSDWAWVPGLSWGPDGKVIYTVDHVIKPNSLSPEESPHFDLIAVPLEGGAPVHLVSDVGMFAYPVPSPIQQVVISQGTQERVSVIENSYQVAYLQAIYPTDSASSLYRLAVMDRDGSNRRLLFPEEGTTGLQPHQVVWSPLSLTESSNLLIAVVYQGNIWFVNPIDGSSQQVTGDGLTVKLDWR